MPQKEVLKQIEELQAMEAQAPVKRGRGRPKGSKDKKPRKSPDIDPTSKLLVDPKTGIVVRNEGQSANIIGRIGDEKVSAFVAYHMEMAKMRQGVDKKNVPDLYNRFFEYLQYCEKHGIMPNNMNAYYALGISRQEIDLWNGRTRGTQEQHDFAVFIKDFFASIHEQGAVEGIINPITSIFWQKAHDGMIEASKLEVVNQDPLGDRKSAEDIAKAYEEVNLPD